MSTTTDRPFTAATDTFAFAQAFTAPASQRTDRVRQLRTWFRSRGVDTARAGR